MLVRELKKLSDKALYSLTLKCVRENNRRLKKKSKAALKKAEKALRRVKPLGLELVDTETRYSC